MSLRFHSKWKKGTHRALPEVAVHLLVITRSSTGEDDGALGVRMGFDEMTAVCREEDVDEHMLHWPIFGLLSLDNDVAAASATIASLQVYEDVTIGFLASTQGKMQALDCGSSGSHWATLVEAVARLWLRHFSPIGGGSSTSVTLSQIRAKMIALPTLLAHEELGKSPCDIFPFTRAHFSSSTNVDRSAQPSSSPDVDDLLPTMDLFRGPTPPSITMVEIFGQTLQFWLSGEEHKGHLRIYTSTSLAFKTYKMDVNSLAQSRGIVTFSVSRAIVDHVLFSLTSFSPIAAFGGDDHAITAERWLVHGQQDVVCRVAQLSGGEERRWKVEQYFDLLEVQLRRRGQKGDGAKSSRRISQRKLEEEIVNQANLIAARLCDKQDWASSGLQQWVHRLLNEVREGRASHVTLLNAVLFVVSSFLSTLGAAPTRSRATASSGSRATALSRFSTAAPRSSTATALTGVKEMVPSGATATASTNTTATEQRGKQIIASDIDVAEPSVNDRTRTSEQESETEQELVSAKKRLIDQVLTIMLEPAEEEEALDMDMAAVYLSRRDDTRTVNESAEAFEVAVASICSQLRSFQERLIARHWPGPEGFDRSQHAMSVSSSSLSSSPQPITVAAGLGEQIIQGIEVLAQRATISIARLQEKEEESDAHARSALFTSLQFWKQVRDLSKTFAESVYQPMRHERQATDVYRKLVEAGLGKGLAQILAGYHHWLRLKRSERPEQFNYEYLASLFYAEDDDEGGRQGLLHALLRLDPTELDLTILCEDGRRDRPEMMAGFVFNYLLRSQSARSVVEYRGGDLFGQGHGKVFNPVTWIQKRRFAQFRVDILERLSPSSTLLNDVKRYSTSTCFLNLVQQPAIHLRLTAEDQEKLTKRNGLYHPPESVAARIDAIKGVLDAALEREKRTVDDICLMQDLLESR